MDQVNARRGLSLTDAVVLATLTQANSGAWMPDSGHQSAFVTYDASPPDDLLRPISINAISQSLGLPFETVRRRVRRLAQLGLCRNAPGGIVVIPAARVGFPGHHRELEAGYAALSALHAALAQAGVVFEAPAPRQGEASPVRAAARLWSEYLLRVVVLALAAFGDVVSAAIWFEVFRSNTELDCRTACLGAEVDRQPVTASQAARRLRLPIETTRRRLWDLAEMGSCVRARRGFVVPDAALERGAVIQLAAQNLLDLQRMYLRLAAVERQPALRAMGSLGAGRD
ncbi:hypothetical protein ACO2Q0_00475 [Phenylobacterium sp. VNQ135]